MTWLWVKSYPVESAEKTVNSLRVETILCPHLQHQVEKLTSACCVLSCFSRVRLFVTLWTIACQAPLSMGLSRQEQWSGLPCPPPGDLSDPGTEPTSLMSPALTGRVFTTSAPWEAHSFSSVQFRSSVVSDSLRPHESQHARPPCSSPSPGVYSDSRPSSP